MDNIKELLHAKHEEIVARIDEYNAALKKNDFAAMSNIEGQLKEAEASYAETKCNELFARLAKSENPIKQAVIEHSYLTTGHKVKREDGVIKGFEIAEDKSKQIDLIKFCKYCNKSVEWQYSVQKFNQLLAMRAATELKMTKAQIKAICDSFYMDDLARKVDLGETPDSNTAICKQLQMVLDAILFEDNGKGKNAYRVNNHDVAYLLMCYTKRGKKTLSVAVAKNEYVHRLIMDVAHRIVTEKTYDLEYRMISADKVSKTKTKPAEEKKAEAPKTEGTETVIVKKTA